MVAGLIGMVQSPLGLRAQDAQVIASAPGPAAPGPADAQSADDQDPPSRVARVNYVEGAVSFQPGSENENDWVSAEPNRPLVTGDNLWADENSRAEVHIGSTALRLGPQTGMTLLELSDRVSQIRLAQGSLIVRVRHVDREDSYEIDTPNLALVVMQPGDYRIDVDPDGKRTDVTVWRGRCEVTGGGNSYTLAANQRSTFTSTGNDHMDHDAGDVPGDDGFDRWALDRDQSEENSDAASYVSPEMTGYEDLNQYGDWSYVADYGEVWYPRALAEGWAPYRFGHWIWVGPWGWTWMAEEPWGFAPFHYGRWAQGAKGWMWVPGPSAVRPVYAPAMVAWLGGAPGFRFSAGLGVGWFPLGPGEVFVPGYRTSRAYLNRVNITNATVNVAKVTSVYQTVVNRNANSIPYANRNMNGGVTVVSRETFMSARPVARNVVSLSAKELAAVPVSNTVAVEPEKSSVLGTGRPVANRPPAAVMTRPVVALRTPVVMPRSFEQRPAQAGSEVNQPSSSSRALSVQPSVQQSLVRQELPGRPVPLPVTRQPKTDEAFRAFAPSGGGDKPKPLPRVWEEQGTPEPEQSSQSRAENRSAQSSNPRSPQAAQQRSAEQRVPQTARPAAPVQRNQQPPREPEEKPSSWAQKPASAQPKQLTSSSSSSSSHAASAPKK